MQAFEVSLNGEKLCLAGVGDDGVLTTTVNWVARKGECEMFLMVGGLLSRTEEHDNRVDLKYLSVGNEICVKIIEASSVDKPIDKPKPSTP